MGFGAVAACLLLPGLPLRCEDTGLLVLLVPLLGGGLAVLCPTMSVSALLDGARFLLLPL